MRFLPPTGSRKKTTRRWRGRSHGEGWEAGLAASGEARHIRWMNQTDVMLRIVDMATVGGAIPADEAIALVAAMIGRLDMLADSYEDDVAVLLKIGATLWVMAKG